MVSELVHVVITGRVQGVGYRFFARDAAQDLKLTGWVRNLPGGAVEAEAEGPRAKLEAWIEELKVGPAISRVDDVQVDWRPSAVQYSDFSIR